MITYDTRDFSFYDHDTCDVTLEVMITLYKLGLSDYNASMQLPPIGFEPAMWTLMLYRDHDDD